MSNILAYFNAFLDVIFDGALVLYSPATVISYLANINYTSGLEPFILNVLHHPEYFLSYVVWVWFACLSFKLLLILPYKFFKSLVKRK